MSQKKWQLKQRFAVLEIVVVAGLCLGCTLSGVSWKSLFTKEESLPFGISKPVYRLSGPDDLCSVGGVFFDFYNKSEKEVVFINACMNMFDSSGALAFDGAAGISSGAACKIPGNNNKNLCISLDEFQSAG